MSFQLENILLTSADVATAETRLGDFGFATHTHGRSLTRPHGTLQVVDPDL